MKEFDASVRGGPFQCGEDGIGKLRLRSFPMRPCNGGPLSPGPTPRYARYCAEPKYNGWRATLHAPSGMMWNRRGEVLSIADEFAEAVERVATAARLFGGGEWFDCEGLERRHALARGTLLILDVPDLAPARGLPATPEARFFPSYLARREWLEARFESCPLVPGEVQPNCAYIAPRIPGVDAAQLYHRLKELDAGTHFYEGVVLKRNDSAYTPQAGAERESREWFKHRWDF